MCNSTFTCCLPFADGGPIPTDLLCSVRSLRDLQIHDMRWLEPPAALDCCDSLTHFVIGYYEFNKTSIVENCTALDSFSLYYGELVEFPDLSSNAMLTYVDVSYNKISTLDPNKLPQSGHLRTLWLGHNMFLSMPDLSQIFLLSVPPNMEVNFVSYEQSELVQKM